MMQQIQVQMAAFQKEVEGAISKVLTAKQRERLEQIFYQREGTPAVIRPEVAKKLNVNPIQKQKIEAILAQANTSRQEIGQQMREQMMARFRGGNNGGNGGGRNPRDMSEEERTNLREEMTKSREKMEEQQKSIKETQDTQIAKVLTANQKKAFNKMLGEPFDLTKLQFNFGNRRGGDRDQDQNAANATPKASAGAVGAQAPVAKPAEVPAAQPDAKKSLSNRRFGSSTGS